MVTLAHFKKQKLQRLLEKNMVIQKKYVENVYGVEKDLIIVLDEVSTFFEQIGKTGLESKVITLKSYLTSAIHGLNPKTLERITINKRSVVKLSTFYAASELSQLLETELAEVENTLRESSHTINQILMSLISNKIITDKDLIDLDSLEKIKYFWNDLTTKNNQIKMFEIQLKQKILNEDIYLLISDVIDNIKTN